MNEAGTYTGTASPQDSSLLRISIAAIIFFWVETFIVGFLETESGYSQIEHAISLLTRADPPLGLVHRLSFVLLAFGVAGFAYVFAKWLDGNPWVKQFLIGFLLLHAIGRAAEGIFLWNPDAPASVQNLLHQGLGMLGVIAMIPIPFLASVAAPRATVSRVSLAVGVVFLGLFAVGVILALIPVGLGQRTGFLLWYGWLVYFGATYRESRYGQN